VEVRNAAPTRGIQFKATKEQTREWETTANRKRAEIDDQIGVAAKVKSSRDFDYVPANSGGSVRLEHLHIGYARSVYQCSELSNILLSTIKQPPVGIGAPLAQEEAVNATGCCSCEQLRNNKASRIKSSTADEQHSPVRLDEVRADESRDIRAAMFDAAIPPSGIACRPRAVPYSRFVPRGS